ncbi:RDD family protein [Brachybacterium sp. YJGR34]|uniref:RDD family protein n=1 Tax=Brachybacterium sp. YJGR34 TaxID=2059911 RepID=UPI000E0A371C|nr:RDD family protein [Brachybacterium sp. YJGR34]
MHHLAGRRLAGYLLDCSGYLGICAALLPAGIATLRLTDLGSSRTYAYLISAVPPALATLVAARAESGPHGATWGKRRQGLRVVAVDAAEAAGGADGAGRAAMVDPTPLPLPRALLRSTVKIFVPWQLAHVTGIGAAWGGFERGDRVTWTATVLTYAGIGAFAVMGLRGSGRGPHDLAAGTAVVLSAPATGGRSR